MSRLSYDDPEMLSPLVGSGEPHQRAEKSSAEKLMWTTFMLLSGTFTTLVAKGLYTTNADGTQNCNMNDDDDKYCDFNKPWFTVLVMKLSMSLCLPLYYWLGWGKDNPNAPNPSWTTIKAVALPASLDLLNTVLGNIGLLYVDSSIYQMTRGSVVIFSAIMSVKYLGRRLYSFHYWAIGMVIVAVILVGTAGTQSSDSSSSQGDVLLGLGFIILAQAVTACQFIAEESLMNNKLTEMDPVALVGFEGIWGLSYFVILAPILTVTPRSSMAVSIVWHEDFGDTFVQLSNSSDLCWLCFGYFVAILVYNVSANFVTQCLSAVVRSILEACRVMGVWVVSLVLWYCFSGPLQGIGEQWSDWSYMQLCGFGILMYGTFAYKSLVKLPCVSEEVYEMAFLDAKEQAAKDAMEDRKHSTDYQLRVSHDPAPMLR